LPSNWMAFPSHFPRLVVGVVLSVLRVAKLTDAEYVIDQVAGLVGLLRDLPDVLTTLIAGRTWLGDVNDLAGRLPDFDQ
jgi:hypothetical protein